jgi:MFS family permease
MPLAGAQLRRTVPDRRYALAVLCLTQFMLVLDVNIVNIALPSLRRSLGIAESDLQWVVSAYVLCFGGFLLLSGRAADLFGRRKVFLFGIGLFTCGSVVCGTALNSAVVILGRVLQGVGAAAASPAALAIVSTLFPQQGPSRRRALGIWSAAAPAGGAAGLILGGILTQAFGWRAVFLVNIPIGLALFWLTPLLVLGGPSSARSGPLDVGGAITITAGIAAVVWGFSEAQTSGFLIPKTLAAVLGGLVLLLAFVQIERGASSALIPPRAFRLRGLPLGTMSALALTATTSPMGFLISQYLQLAAGFSPSRAGLAYLPVLVSVAVGALSGPRLIQLLGPGLTLSAAFLCIAMGVAIVALRIGAGEAYLSGILPGGFAYGAGLGAGSVASTVVGTSGATQTTQGLVSGILNAAAPIGTALGLAVLVNVVLLWSPAANSNVGAKAALSAGLHVAFLVDSIGAASLAAAIAASTRFRRQRDA